ncbi:glucose-1-phosphate adenylyltransferase [Verrucomicrobium sp. GAS474]|uniref:glucose-1-phosphate adenylyltransferase n=1 Tax=Verrucomicrobium sp. GAS474 TaxID=1882831 RepID=UPI00087DA9C1|nr:glucose-1-phosphate adenylyltransferase [Verrucomicrobium sp. GAS474]SDT95339.1 glucose-1-phosphate adenylyltransferase [Verrucomicrobium sp. GAS474]
MDSLPCATVASRDVLAIIMGGGAGTRLFPLTKDRSKPAVPLAGKYRLVDIPISLCINSGFHRIFVLTQFNSSSLHRHIQQSYRFDDYSGGFVEIMAAQQTPKGATWYQGTADAVRQNLRHFENHAHDLVLILSGDQLFRMDFRRLIDQHVRSKADVTVAAIPVGRSDATGFGILEIDQSSKITRFVEKPKDPVVLDQLRLSDEFLRKNNTPSNDPLYLASMGIYVFNRSVLKEALAGTETDFGKDIIPTLIKSHRVQSHLYQGYWEDIGTIKAFFDANLDLCEAVPKFNFYDSLSPIYTHARYLPATKISNSKIDRAVIGDGSIILDATVERCLIGIRSRINNGAVVKNCIIMGQDFYEEEPQAAESVSKGLPRVGIGYNTKIERAIIDKNARIGDNVVISPEGKPTNFDAENYYIRDGIVVIPKDAVIPHGAVI